MKSSSLVHGRGKTGVNECAKREERYRRDEETETFWRGRKCPVKDRRRPLGRNGPGRELEDPREGSPEDCVLTEHRDPFLGRHP